MVEGAPVAPVAGREIVPGVCWPGASGVEFFETELLSVRNIGPFWEPGAEETQATESARTVNFSPLGESPLQRALGQMPGW